VGWGSDRQKLKRFATKFLQPFAAHSLDNRATLIFMQKIPPNSEETEEFNFFKGII
jgi:hypothetical protein